MKSSLNLNLSKPIIITLYSVFSAALTFGQWAIEFKDYWGEPVSASHMLRENHGQVMTSNGQYSEDIVVYANAPGLNFWAMPQSFSLSSSTIPMGGDLSERETHRIDIHWSNPMPYSDYGRSLHGESEQVFNYYLPGMPQGPATGVKEHERLVYTDIADGVDFHIYSNQAGFKMAYYVHPGGDLSDVVMEFDGQDALWVDSLERLDIITSGGMINIGQAMAYQTDLDGEVIDSTWTPEITTDGEHSVEIDPLSYDHDLPLIVVFSERGSSRDDEGSENVGWSTYWGDDDLDQFRCLTSSDNAIYIAGNTISVTFPEVTGSNSSPVDTSGFDVVVLKMDANQVPKWGTFVGGHTHNSGSPIGARDEPNDIALDQAGNAYVVGFTEAEDFHVEQGAFTYFDNQNNCTDPGGCTDAFLFRLEAVSGGLQYSTLYGANGNEVFHGVNVDDEGNIYCVGEGNENTPLEQLSGAYYDDTKGSGLIVKFDDQADRQLATRFGSSNNEDVVYSIVDDGVGGHYIAGKTDATGALDFPIVDPNVTPTGHLAAQGGFDGFLGRLDRNDGLQWCVLTGGTGFTSNSNGDEIFALDKTSEHNVVGVGRTRSDLGFGPLVSATGAFNRSYRAGSGDDTYIIECDTTGKVVWATYAGTSFNDVPYDVHVAENGIVYIGGITESDSLPGMNLTMPAGFYVRDSVSGFLAIDRDGYIMAFDNGREMLWRTTYGSGGPDPANGIQQSAVVDNVRGVATTDTGSLYVIGRTANQLHTDFLLMDYDPNSIQDYFQSTPCAFGDVSHGWGALFDVSGIRVQGLPTALPETIPDLSQWLIYPNPANGHVVIDNKSEETLDLKITDISGKLVQAVVVNGASSTVLDLSRLASGLYIASGMSHTQKIIIK